MDEPPTSRLDDFYIRSFWELSSTRIYETGQIPWNRTLEYGYSVGINDDIIKMFVSVVRAMDEAYLGWLAEEAERRRSK